MDLNNINVADYEFSGEQLGELLLKSVQQAKANQVSNVRQIAVNNAIDARKKTGMSQVDFAKIMGISVRTLQSWEQGRRVPSGSAATLLKIVSNHPEVLIELSV